MPTVLITGANRGIGLGLAHHYGIHRWRVLAAARNPRTAELQAFANDTAYDVEPVTLDVAEPAAIDRLAEDIDEPIDLLINNAGIFGPRPQTLAEVDAGLWLDIFKVNTVAPLLMAKAFRGHLLRGGRRKLVNISSRAGSFADNKNGNFPMYRASKAALNMSMQSLALEWQEAGIPVGVLLLSPGWVRTDMGTSEANLDISQSVLGITTVIERFEPGEGLAYRNYDGTDIAW